MTGLLHRVAGDDCDVQLFDGVTVAHVAVLLGVWLRGGVTHVVCRVFLVGGFIVEDDACDVAGLDTGAACHRTLEGRSGQIDHNIMFLWANPEKT